MSKFVVEKKRVFIAGGSKGLGKALAVLLASRGANIVILARSKKPLEEAKVEILQARRSAEQKVETISVDLGDPEAIRKQLDLSVAPPDILICTAGGTSTQLGFLADIKPESIRSCLESNYYTAVFITQHCLKRWLQDPTNTTRTIVLTSSTAALVSLPGYGAYTPTKVAVRALADTLRQELLLYGDSERYQVHCCFPGTFLSDAFHEEQVIKPALTKELERTDKPLSVLQGRYDTAEEIAGKLIRGLEDGRYFVTMDLDTALLLNNMRGPSPRDRTLYEYFLGWAMGLIWPTIRAKFDQKTREYGRMAGLRSSL